MGENLVVGDMATKPIEQLATLVDEVCIKSKNSFLSESHAQFFF